MLSTFHTEDTIGGRLSIRDFMAANPNIIVKPVGVASNEILARVRADVVAGLQPDVAQLVFRDLYFTLDASAGARVWF